MNDADDPAAKPTVPALKPVKRPLEGLVVGISVALGEDSAARGFGDAEMNRVVVRLSDALLSAGARLVFGHDWRPTGVMAAVARLAVTYDQSAAALQDSSARKSCRITNLVPWDRRPELPADLREDLEKRGMLRVEEVPLPPAFAQLEPEIGRRSLRAAALCVLRRRLAELCDARICVGGKYQKYEGFFPGILEEAFTSASRDRGNKVLLSALLGGAAAKILRAARTNDWNDFLQPNADEELRKGYARLSSVDPTAFPDLHRAPDALNWNRLQERSGLTSGDWECLASATDIEVVSAMAIKALSKPTPPPAAGDAVPQGNRE